MSTPTDEFDAIAKALESGDTSALDKLMNSDEEIQDKEPEADPTESAEELIPGDDAEPKADESEESPSNEEVANGESTEPVAKEEPSTPEAAVPAASTANETDELKRELQRYKSDAGRVPFIQRRMAELERELRAYKAREAQTTQSTPKVTTDGVELDEETKRQIEELKEVDPVMAKTMERVAKAAIASSRAQVETVFTTYTQAEQESDDNKFLMEQQAELVRDIPNAYQIFAHPAWTQWKQTLTPGQRAMAESAYAADVKQAIYAFAAVMQQAEGQGQQPAQPAAEPAAPVATQPVATPAPEVSDKIKEARARKVNAAPEVKSGSPKAATEFDEEAMFREMYEKIGKENHILK